MFILGRGSGLSGSFGGRGLCLALNDLLSNFILNDLLDLLNLLIGFFLNNLNDPLFCRR
jgi:hypothetical protein